MPDSDSNDITRSHVQLAHGSIIGHYRIIEKIGAGGMGEVYLAEDTKLDRQVALKFLPPHLCQDAECRTRFTREAQAAAKLDHPNIVAVHEVGEFQGRPFFSMQHVEGQSLKEVIAGKTLPLDRVIDLGIQVCEGLQAAHEGGITHRDIKPSNILIDSHGRARIVDFGLASVMGLDRLTKTGSTLGTIGYMSPEQVRGENLDHRTDLFSLGVVLYELITGHSPFKSDSEAATLHAITDSMPEPLARFRREVPPKLQTIIDKALDKRIATRYQHADDLGADLERISTPTSLRPTLRHVPLSRLVIVAFVVLILTSLGYWGVTRFVSKEGQKPAVELKMLAVLPLENIGPAEQEYFADGLTDEITTKLSGVSGLRVIAQSSASQYKKTSKTIAQIGKELGAGYLLRGTIRWERRPDGTQHLRVNPQLVQVSDGSQVWSQSYEGALAGVFEMQSNIATQVTQALGVALLAEEQKTLEEKPTNNMEAYGYYLEGLQLWGKSGREATLQAIRMLRKAAELDSSFTAAYSCLGGAYAWVYFRENCRNRSFLEEAKKAADRAVALRPTSVDADIAQAYYYYYGFRNYDRALTFLNNALAKSPSNSGVLELIGYVSRRQGKFAEAADLLERSIILNPRSFWLPQEIGVTYWRLRDYSKAEEYMLRGTVIDPGDFTNWASLSLLYIVWRGDTKAARAALREGTKHVDSLKLGLAYWYVDLLEQNYPEAERHLHDILATSEADTAAYYLARACTARLMDKVTLAHACFDSLRAYGKKSIQENPTFYYGYSQAGLAYAGLGRKGNAVAMGKKAVELMPLGKDAVEALLPLYSLARIYAMVGDQGAAIDELEQVLGNPTQNSANSIRLEPYWIPLRDHPRFQKLLEKYGT